MGEGTPKWQAACLAGCVAWQNCSCSCSCLVVAAAAAALVAEVLYRPFNNVCHKADTDRRRLRVCVCVCVPDTVQLLLLLFLLLLQGQAVLESIWPGHNSPEIIYICLAG